jgi:hypothetical protein
MRLTLQIMVKHDKPNPYKSRPSDQQQMQEVSHDY